MLKVGTSEAFEVRANLTEHLRVVTYGDDNLNVPLQGSAPVVSTGVPVTWSNGTFTNITWSNQVAGAQNVLYDAAPAGPQAAWEFGTTTGLETDLSQASGVTINELREAFQIQKMFERDARGGTRYTEIIHSHFGVISPDMRLQRPEYLGGGSTSINVTPVAQTSVTAATPQGNLAAFGTLALSRCGFVKSFTEHGYIIGLASVRADLNYQQGLHRMWSRSTRYDFYWPALSHIGEQAVLNQEIYFAGNGSGVGNDGGTFGYQERYGEYRYFPGQITGLFRTAAAGSLDSWHLAQNFGSLPGLNGTFIVENAPMTRIKATASDPDSLFDSYFDLKCARPMPVYAVPGLIDHF